MVFEKMMAVISEVVNRSSMSFLLSHSHFIRSLAENLKTILGTDSKVIEHRSHDMVTCALRMSHTFIHHVRECSLREELDKSTAEEISRLYLSLSGIDVFVSRIVADASCVEEFSLHVSVLLRISPLVLKMVPESVVDDRWIRLLGIALDDSNHFYESVLVAVIDTLTNIIEFKIEFTDLSKLILRALENSVAESSGWDVNLSSIRLAQSLLRRSFAKPSEDSDAVLDQRQIEVLLRLFQKSLESPSRSVRETFFQTVVEFRCFRHPSRISNIGTLETFLDSVDTESGLESCLPKIILDEIWLGDLGDGDCT